MRLGVMVAVLSMLCGTACSEKVKIAAATPDPAKLAECPRELPTPGALPALQSFVLPDGQVVVPLSQVQSREGRTVEALLLFRGGWLRCRSSVVYVEQWGAALKR